MSLLICHENLPHEFTLVVSVYLFLKEIMMIPLLEEKLMAYGRPMHMEDFRELLRPQEGSGSMTPQRETANL